MYVCLYVRMHTCMYAYVHTCMMCRSRLRSKTFKRQCWWNHSSLSDWAYVHMHISMHLYVHTYMYIHTRGVFKHGTHHPSLTEHAGTCMYVYTHVCLHARIYVRKYVQKWIYHPCLTSMYVGSIHQRQYMHVYVCISPNDAKLLLQALADILSQRIHKRLGNVGYFDGTRVHFAACS